MFSVEDFLTDHHHYTPHKNVIEVVNRLLRSSKNDWAGQSSLTLVPHHSQVDGDTDTLEVQEEFTRVLLEEMDKAEALAAIPQPKKQSARRGKV